jgi:cytoskeletal protein CcmA (bactofilin family)
MSNGTTAAIVGEDAQFNGRFSGQDLDVQGRLEGEVEVKGRLRVGKQGRVKAKVKAAIVEIEGEFEGELRADALTLAESAKAKGTFVAKRLNVKEGAVLEGSINPAVAAPAAAPAGTTAIPAPGPAPASNAGGSPSATAPSASAPSGAAPSAGAPVQNKPEDGGKTP